MRTWVCGLRATSARCVVVGVQGVQGSGKSTLCRRLEATVPGCVWLSLDDFYLPDAALDHSHPDPRLRGRGNPGTHDVARLRDCVDALRAGTNRHVDVPVYDKRLRAGRGDRTDEVRRVDATGVRVVLLEGWCVGFRPRGDDGDAVDAHLRAYVPLFDALDASVVLRADPAWAYEWRAEAEPPDGMSDVRAFVDRFRPTYERYLAGLYDEDPPPAPRLHVALDRDRRATLTWTSS